jgi:plasmanylethanolamine desaturase
VIAFLLLPLLVIQIITKSHVFAWHTLLAIPAGMILADFLSGLVHWGADTWGRESMPILGKRLLHPFRVHHVNPADFLRRRFFDTNGDVAFLAIPAMLVALQIPLTTAASVFGAVLLTSFSAVGLMTNQIHQWAHMQKAPLPIYWLQQLGIILSFDAHEKHHSPPYVQNYCIATGWCNRPLQALKFFSRLERIITLCTGLQPRHDEREFSQSVFTEKHSP